MESDPSSHPLSERDALDGKPDPAVSCLPTLQSHSHTTWNVSIHMCICSPQTMNYRPSNRAGRSPRALHSNTTHLGVLLDAHVFAPHVHEQSCVIAHYMQGKRKKQERKKCRSKNGALTTNIYQARTQGGFKGVQTTPPFGWVVM